MQCNYHCGNIHFYPRPPRGGRPASAMHSTVWREISIHALREEGDVAEKAIFHGVVCISIHALREEGDARRFERRQMQAISIHALREEGDRGGRRSGLLSCHFYPRPPRGGRPDETGRYRRAYRFLSTPSARRATQVNDGVAVVEEFLSTPSARRATPGCMGR